MPNRKSLLTLSICLAAITLLVPALAVAEHEVDPTVSAKHLSADITSWGRVVSHWELHANGEYIQWEQDFYTREIKNRLSVNKGPETYTKAVSIVEGLTGLSGIDCTDAPTDGPSVEYHFPNGGALSFYLGCYSSKRKPDIQKLWDAETALYSLIPWLK